MPVAPVQVSLLVGQWFSKQGLLELYSASRGMEVVSFEMLASWTRSVSKCACLHLSESDKLQLLL